MGSEPLAEAGAARRVGGRAGANLEALRVLARLREEGRAPTEVERETLAGWRSWGAEPGIFEEDTPRAQALRSLLSDEEWKAARRTTINAHYTDPSLVTAIWQGARGLGFDGGRVLEPGCGSGLFIGAAPPDLDTDITGIELDPVTAEIAQHLHPRAGIRAESFAVSPLPDQGYDLTIGNVPFANVSLYDPRHNQGKHSMHNHFIIKSLHLTRPGGMLAVLTSRYTMDRVDEKARREMHDLGDLVGAVRLPTGAHRSYAGTEAVTDLVIIRRRMEGDPRRDASWLASVPDETLGIRLNDYWRAHPERVLGQMSVEPGMYGQDDLRVRAADLADVPRALTEQVEAIVREAREAGLTFTGPRAEPTPILEPIARVADARLFRGHLEERQDGTWTQLTAFGAEPIEVPASASVELRALAGLRDATLRVLDLEGQSREDTVELAAARRELSAGYAAYTQSYGPINRVKISESSRLDKTGNPIVSRRYPTAARIFRSDPHASLVKALEQYDESTGVATPAAILERRVLAPSAQLTHAETPADALAIVLDTTGRVDLHEVAALLDTDSDDARRRLGTLVFDDPTSGRLLAAPEYLSGNVRQALSAAQAAAEEDPRFKVNVEHLERVIPRDLAPEEIKANLGAIWVPASDMTAFLRQTLDEGSVKVEHLGGANWKVRGGQRWSTAATATWGTDRMPAHEIAERLMRQQRVVVNDIVPTPDGGEASVVNVVETEAAAAKAEALQERFSAWAWEDPARAERLARIYNDTFNAIVLRSYDAEGERLSLPGLAVGFEPHPHQRAAVARMISEPSVGLFHAVGAGKTAEMVMGTTELKRLGLVNKPCVVVPNHMLEQFSREWLQLYPAANILAAASEDLRGDGRRDFIAKAATGEWDAVVLTQSAFGSIPVSLEAERSYFDSEIEVMRRQLSTAENGEVSRQSLKSMEKAILRQESRLQSLIDRKRDPGLTWEQTGIDYLVVDELHLFKNLAVVSNIQDVAKDGSQRATDLDMKIHLLREKAGPRGRVLTGATATPIANSMAEAWVMQKYLRPDLLLDAGLTDFDSWAATFGRTVSKLEMRPAGDGFTVKDRFAAFDNVPELLRLWHVPADVKTARDLKLPVPAIARDAQGKRTPEIVAVPMSSAQRAFMGDLAERSKAVRDRAVKPDEDNMLKISSDGRSAGVDLRLLNDAAQWSDSALFDEPSKIDVAADRIAGLWREHRGDRFPGSDKPGALQIVFCDRGTPKPDEWNVYDGLKASLVERGMNPSRVRFIHEAANDDQKGRLFAACRAGDVDVLIGSTDKMGVGTNIQARALALHHLDCPWRPADVEQREGRILRQGNANPEIQILRYVTEGSFDGFMWQGVARKAAFIDQVMHGKLDQRTAEDLDSGDGEQFDFATVTAVASGNPLLSERAEAQADLDKLRRLSTGHERAQEYLRASVRALTARQNATTSVIPRLEAAASRTLSTRGEHFAATIGPYRFTERTKAADELRRHLDSATGQLTWSRTEVRLPGAVRLGGHSIDLTVKKEPAATKLTAAVAGLEGIASFTTSVDAAAGTGLVTRLENLAAGLSDQLTNEYERLDRINRDLAAAQRDIGAPFARAVDLARAEERVASIDATLAKADEGPTEQDDARVLAAQGAQAQTDRHRVGENRRGRARASLADYGYRHRPSTTAPSESSPRLR